MKQSSSALPLSEVNGVDDARLRWEVTDWPPYAPSPETLLVFPDALHRRLDAGQIGSLIVRSRSTLLRDVSSRDDGPLGVIPNNPTSEPESLVPPNSVMLLHTNNIARQLARQGQAHNPISWGQTIDRLVRWGATRAGVNHYARQREDSLTLGVIGFVVGGGLAAWNAPEILHTNAAQSTAVGLVAGTLLNILMQTLHAKDETGWLRPADFVPLTLGYTARMAAAHFLAGPVIMSDKLFQEPSFPPAT
jgi:hypothetical protein